MNYKSLIIIFFIFLLGCEQNNLNKNVLNQEIVTKYKNSGFALVYDSVLKKEKKISKKIDNRSLLIFHKSLKKNSFVKITNPVNQKTVIAEVISNKVKFSDFYNSVITSRIAEELSLNLNEPYINLVLISQNSTFVAKKAKTFKEEKKVAEKAPVDGIQIDNLGEINQQKKEAIKEEFFSYSIKIADFYYKDSARTCLIELLMKQILRTLLFKQYLIRNIGYY
jgi:hypothetical protein